LVLKRFSEMGAANQSSSWRGGDAAPSPISGSALCTSATNLILLHPKKNWRDDKLRLQRGGPDIMTQQSIDRDRVWHGDRLID
jgi:hypothetical protein